MQVLRINKFDLIPVIFRCYGTQRSHRNYYEILEVSPDCSQKEIRRAFLVLSKKWHPDIVGDKGHDKFVKLQEAYNILGKEDTRRHYDFNLRYHTYSPRSSPHVRPVYPSDSARVYKSHKEWEEHMARGNWQPGKLDPKDYETNRRKVMKVFMILWMVLAVFQFLTLHSRMHNTRKNLQHEYQREYNLLRKSIKGLTLEQQMSRVENKFNIAHSEEKKEDEK